MILTTEQLERIAYALAMSEDRTRETDRHVSSEARICLAAVNGELHRRQRGPFTLAEAIASGRPFRRKVWGCKGSDYDGMWITSIVDGDTGLCFCSDEVSLFHVEPDDITATDYEVQE